MRRGAVGMAAGPPRRVCVCVEARGPAEGLEALLRGLRELEGPSGPVPGPGPGGARGGLRSHGLAPRPGEGGGVVLSVSVAGARPGSAAEEEEACAGLRALLPPGVPPVELEVLLTAPCPVPLGPDWTLEGALLVSGAEGGAPWGPEAGTALADAGLFTAPGALGGDTLEKLRELCAGRIRAADAALAARGVAAGEATFAFREIASRGGQRFDLLLLEQEEAEIDSGPPHKRIYSPSADEGGAGSGGLQGTAAEEAFLQRVAREAPWTPLIERVLGGRGHGVRLWVSVVYSRPGAPPQEWHADGPHVGRCAGWDSGDGGGEAPPYALCVFVPLCDLSREVGFTQFWPGTHRHAQLLGFGGACEVLGAHCDGLLRAGDALVYDYRLMHRGMPNRSAPGPAGRQRAILQFFYHDASYTERRNYGEAALFAHAPEAPPGRA